MGDLTVEDILYMINKEGKEVYIEDGKVKVKGEANEKEV